MWVRLCLETEIHVIEEPLIRHRIRSEMKNLDADTPQKISRVFWEFSKVMRRFCLIKDNAELVKIFPEAKIGVENGLPMTTNLALLALGGKRWCRAFGLDLLYDEIQSFDNVQLLEKIGLGMSDFFKMIADADVFGAVAEATIQKAFEWQEAERKKLLEKYSDEYEELAAVFDRQREYISALGARLGI